MPRRWIGGGRSLASGPRWPSPPACASCSSSAMPSANTRPSGTPPWPSWTCQPNTVATQEPGHTSVGEAVGGEWTGAGGCGRRVGHRCRPCARRGAGEGSQNEVRRSSVGPRPEDGRVSDAAPAPEGMRTAGAGSEGWLLLAMWFDTGRRWTLGRLTTNGGDPRTGWEAWVVRGGWFDTVLRRTPNRLTRNGVGPALHGQELAILWGRRPSHAVPAG